MAEDYFSFEKVLRELRLEEEELKRLVSEGEIRAFRDADKMKFKAEDIARFRGSKDGELPTLEAASEELTEELFGADASGGGDAGMVTQQIDDNAFLEEEIEVEVESIELEEVPAASPGKARSRAGAASGVTSGVRSGVRRRAGEAEDATTEGTGMQVVLVLSAAILLYGMLVAVSAAEVQSSGLTQGIADFVRDNFMK